MNNIVRKFAEQLSVEDDIMSVNGFVGVDKLNELKEKYKNITLSFNKTISNAPIFMDEFIQARELKLFLNGLFERFNSNAINISVVAEVSSGKSTFLNALIFGKKILDAKMGETTAKVFKITYGENEDLNALKEQISNINTKTKDTITHDDFLLENINIEDYIIELKADNENLKKGIVLYDTPGFGTLNEKVMSKLIKEAVNRSDAVVLLLDISKGLKKDEARFIEEALSYINENKRFIVLNKFDASFDEDDDEDEIQKQIDKVVEDTKKDIAKLSINIDKNILDKQTYYLSSLKAIVGKSKNNKEILEFSRFPMFEDSFWSRIVEAKKEIFADAVNSLIGEASTMIDEANKKIDVFHQSINQTNSLVENMEKVADEVKEIVSAHADIVNNIAKETENKVNIVFEKAKQFEEKLYLTIEHSIKQVINYMPSNPSNEDFIQANKEAMDEINLEFQNQYNEFVKSINADIINKEKIVNDAIDSINKDIKKDTFKTLHIQEISRITRNLSKVKAITLEGSNNLDFIAQEQRTFEASNSDNSDKLSVIDENIKNRPISNNETSNGDTSDYLENMTKYGAAGGAAATAIPIPALTTVIGTAAGMIYGMYKTWRDRSDKEEQRKVQEQEAIKQAKHEARVEEQKKHHENMQAMQNELESIREQSRLRDIEHTKREVYYDWTSKAKEQFENFIAELRMSTHNEYGIVVGNIVSTIYNTKSILKDMQTIIEDPTQQKKLIAENEAKIQEAKSFIANIEKCFSK